MSNDIVRYQPPRRRFEEFIYLEVDGAVARGIIDNVVMMVYPFSRVSESTIRSRIADFYLRPEEISSYGCMDIKWFIQPGDYHSG